MSVYYDPTGRISRLTQGANTTRFEHLGPRLIIERNASGAILRRYVHGPGDDEPVVWYEGPALTTKRFLHTDERGSVIAVTDASGAAIGINTYDEYGIPKPSVALATNISGRFSYTGQIWIPELGLYYYKARFYSPTLGRFMQTDPIGYADGINWYNYVDGDPVNKVDPTGLFNVSCKDLPGGCPRDNREWRGFSAGKGGKPQSSKPNPSKSPPGIGHNNPPPSPAWWQVLGRAMGIRGGAIGAATVLTGSSCRSCAINSVSDVLQNPNMLKGVTLDAFHGRVGTPEGWVWGPSGSDGGWKLSQLNDRGTNYTNRQIRWHPGHPGGGRGQAKMEPYWRVNDGPGQSDPIPSGGAW